MAIIFLTMIVIKILVPVVILLHALFSNSHKYRGSDLRGNALKKVRGFFRSYALIPATRTIPCFRVLFFLRFSSKLKLTCFAFLLWPNLTIGFLWPTLQFFCNFASREREGVPSRESVHCITAHARRESSMPFNFSLI